MKWNWIDKGVEIENGKPEPEKFAFLPLKIEEISECALRLNRASEIHGVLRDAKEHFARGAANYKNAFERLSLLLDELDKAALALLEETENVSTFFDPPTLFEAFEKDPEKKIAFATEAVEKLMGMASAR